jgi:predicted dehydrogenase
LRWVPEPAGAGRQVPSDQIVLGMIGVGNMGTTRLRGFLQHQDVRIGAVCDVDGRHLDRAVGIVEAARGHKPKALRDYRRVLDDREINAVVVVTPDHWHAIPTVRAFEAGKDVFVEKPLSYSIAEGRAMADASLKYKRVSQMGNHIHNDLPNYRRVVELVKSGALGRISRVHVWKTSPTEPYQTTEPPQRPPELDSDFWLGPAPKRDYHQLRSHILFRHFWDYSGGTFIDFWCHIVDVAVWALDLKAPTSVSAAGGRFFVNDETETPDMLEAVLEYPGLLFTFSFQPMPPPGFDHMGHIGCIFEGRPRRLVTNYQSQSGSKARWFPTSRDSSRRLVHPGTQRFPTPLNRATSRPRATSATAIASRRRACSRTSPTARAAGFTGTTRGSASGVMATRTSISSGSTASRTGCNKLLTSFETPVSTGA